MLKKVEKSIFLTKPIIGIVGRYESDYVKVNNSVMNAIISCGGIPILILPVENSEMDKVLKLCSGILLPGGTDIYSYDKYICKYAIDNDIPILGICLGMQVMGTIDKDSLKKNVTKHLGVTHKIKTIKGTLINKIIGDTFVNSRHKEHITDPGIYKVSAYSLDGYIEALEHPTNKFNVGVQWHPEDLIDSDIKEFNLIKEFINSCK